MTFGVNREEAMAIRAIAICDGALPVPQRDQLPRVLTRALQPKALDLEALGFKGTDLNESRWIWDWNPDVDGDFQTWLARGVVGLFWPDASGVAVHCSKHATQISTGVRWDSFTKDEEVRNTVSRIVSAIGRSVGAKKAWLVPDAGDSAASRAQDLFFEGASSTDLSATLKDSASTRSVEC
jgi:hypothetical protein